jgi:hypothetical protein
MTSPTFSAVEGHRADCFSANSFGSSRRRGSSYLGKYAMRPLQHRLMLEARGQTARDAQTQLRQF